MVIFSRKSVKEDIFTQKTNFKSIFSSKKLEREQIEELEDLFISADVGTEFTAKIINSISKSKFNKNINFEEVKKILSEQISKLLTPVEKKLEIKSHQKPYIIVFNGVNGAGKTTTIGKISHLLKNEGKKILIASCDTFRAAANEQLKVWAERSGSEVVEASKDGEDPSAVAFRSVKKAIDENSLICSLKTFPFNPFILTLKVSVVLSNVISSELSKFVLDSFISALTFIILFTIVSSTIDVSPISFIDISPVISFGINLSP